MINHKQLWEALADITQLCLYEMKGWNYTASNNFAKHHYDQEQLRQERLAKPSISGTRGLVLTVKQVAKTLGGYNSTF